MKKKNVFLYLIILLVAFVFATDSVHANSSYYVYKRSDSEKYPVPISGGQTTLYFYTTKKDGQDITTTYCVDPARKWGGGVGNLLPYTVIKDFSDEHDSVLYKEMAVAYKQLYDRGYVNDGSLEHRAVGELVARWIITDSGFASGENRKAYGNSDNFLNTNPAVLEAKQIFDVAVRSKNKSYDELVAEGTIWGVQWGLASYIETSTGSNTSKVTFVLKSVNGKVPEITYYNNFSARCTNTNVKCTMSSAGAYSGEYGVQIDMTVEKLNGYTGSDYGIEVTPSYCSKEDIAFQMVLLQSSDQPNTRQRMLMLSSTECPANPMLLPQRGTGGGSGTPGGHPSFRIDRGCICNETTGLWEVTQSSARTSGNSQSSSISKTTYKTYEEAKAAAGSAGSTCPETCNTVIPCRITSDGTHYCKDGKTCDLEKWQKECNNVCNEDNGKYHCTDGRECTKDQYDRECNDGKTCKVENGKYICTKGNECTIDEYRKECLDGNKCTFDNGQYYCNDGSVCTQEEFNKQCRHSCQDPSKSGDGKYYCKESTPGAGDGKECSKEEYIKDCQKCDEWEDKCKDNQNASEPECQDYNQYCLDCTPNVFMPATCNNFNNFDSSVNGIISDISQTSAGRYSCQNNSPKDQIKSCVINRNDAAGDSYNATSTSGIDGDNPYCQVWCKESYKFNVPTARTTNSGSYFTIDASIEGTRDCYVSGHDDPSKGIDKEKFNTDVIKAQQELIEAWNEYNHWKVGSEQPDRTRQDTDSNSCCTETCSDSDGEYCCENCDAEESRTQYYYEWDYTVFDINGRASTQHQSEITNGYASCFCCGCNGVDGHSLLSEFASKRDSLKARVTDALKNLRSIITKYNSCTGVINNPNETSVNVTGWSNKMVDWSIDGPEVWMNFRQDYIKDFNQKLDATTGSIKTNENYCFGDTDSTYKCISGGSASSSSGATEGRNIVFCYTADDSHGATCIYPSIQVGKSNWIKKTKIQSAHFEPNNELSVRSQYGTIQFNSPECNGNDCLYTQLPSDSIPVSLLTKTGVFPFVLSYNKVGQSNKDNSLGRLISSGTTKSVLTEYTRKVSSGEYKKCSISTMQQQAGYVCHYLTNCDDNCLFKCDPDGTCYFKDCEDGNCKFICRDCIFDGDNFTYSFRPVSLSTLFPNERTKTDESGYNWSNDFKGQLTRKVIEQSGDEAYKTPEYSYTLSGLNLKNIKDYNVKVGSFANSVIPSKYERLSNNTTTPKNSAIYCSNLTVNGLDYSVKCNSAFLDIIENDTAHEFAVSSIRPSKDKRFTLFMDLVKSDSDLSKKCTTSKIGDNEWTSSCINRSNAIGPSWK